MPGDRLQVVVEESHISLAAVAEVEARGGRLTPLPQAFRDPDEHVQAEDAYEAARNARLRLSSVSIPIGLRMRHRGIHFREEGLHCWWNRGRGWNCCVAEEGFALLLGQPEDDLRCEVIARCSPLGICPELRVPPECLPALRFGREAPNPDFSQQGS